MRKLFSAKPYSAWSVAAAVAVSLCVLAASARADDKPSADKSGPEGTWKWTFERNGQSTDLSVKLKWADGKLTGAFVGRDGAEMPIKDGRFKDGEVSFQVVRERNGQQFAIKYHGKVDGDTIKGKTEVDVGGQVRTRDWEAKRAAGAGGTLSGPWKVVIESPMGQLERSMKLKQDGEKLAGTFTGQFGEIEIKEGKIKGAEFSFLIAIQRDGESMTFKYQGKQDGDKIKGTVDYDMAGNSGTIDFAGERVKDEPKKEEKKPDGEK